MNDLQQRILDPFVEETLESLTTLARLSASAGEAFMGSVDLFHFGGYAVATQVSGAVPGKVLMHLYPETARDIGERVFERMTGIACNSTVDCYDALSEWANVLVGRATRGLEEARLGVRFTSPFFVQNFDDVELLMRDVVEIISLPIETEECGRLYFNYLLHEKTVA